MSTSCLLWQYFFIYLFFTSSSNLHTFFFFLQSPSSPKYMNILMDFLQSVYLVWCVCVCVLISASIWLLECVDICLCVRTIHIKSRESRAVFLVTSVVLMWEEGQFKRRFRWYCSMNAPDSAVLTVAVSQCDENSEKTWNTHNRDLPIVNLIIYYLLQLVLIMKIEATHGRCLFLHYLRIVCIKNLVRLRQEQVYK